MCLNRYQLPTGKKKAGNSDKVIADKKMPIEIFLDHVYGAGGASQDDNHSSKIKKNLEKKKDFQNLKNSGF